MAKILLVIGAVLAMTVGRSDGTITLPLTQNKGTIGRKTTVACQVTGGETFVAWDTPSKPGQASQSITLSTAGRRSVAQSGDTYTLTIDDITVNDGGNYYCRGSANSEMFTLNVDYVIQNVNVKQTLHLGKTETVVLGVSGYPALTYAWTRDGQLITFTAGGHRTLNPQTGSITFSPVQQSDQGNYTCVVSSAVLGGHTFDPISVTVIDAPKINKYLGDPVSRRLTQGYNNTFHCDIMSGSPKPTVKWYFGWTTTLKEVDPVYYPRSYTSEEEWTITGVLIEDAGKYRCIAENIAGTDELKFWITAVDVPPVIDPPLTDVTVSEGANQDLECKVSGTPLPSVEWQQNGVRYRDQSMSTEGSKAVQKISFNNIQWVNSGQYTCKATNGALDSNRRPIVAEQTISLNVNSPPRIITAASPSEVYSFVGYQKSVTVACVFSGYPLPLVKMVNDSGQEIARGNSSAIFTLKTNSNNDFGKFNCTAENLHGTQDFIVELKVAVPPGPPRNLFANRTCNVVILNWEQPFFDGGLPIFQYYIRLTAQGGEPLLQQNVARDLWQAKIEYNSFVADTSYIVYLRAQSNAGYGQEEMVRVRTKKYCVPGRPTITKQEDEVETSFTLTWDAPAYDGGDPNIKYKVEWRKKPVDSDTIAEEVDNISGNSLRITDLEGGAQYEFKVFAKNAEGYSAPATWSYNVRREDDTTDGGPDKNEPEVGARTQSGLGAGAIAGIVIAVILIVLITIDLFCCFFNSCGIIFCCHQAICGGDGAKGKDSYKDGKATEMEKKPLPENV